MCREILNTCVRNTEEAEKNSKTSGSRPSSAVSETAPASQIASGRGQKKGLWGLIEDSELAKSIRKDEKEKVRCIVLFYLKDRDSKSFQMENDVVTRARACIVQLSNLVLSSPIPPSPSPSSPSPSTPTMQTPKVSNNNNMRQQSLEELTTTSGAIIVELRAAIQETVEDQKRLEELLSVNDQLVGVLGRIPSLGGGNRNAEKRPKLVLQGLGLSLDENVGEVNSDGDSGGVAMGSTGGGDVGNGNVNVNGVVGGHESVEEDEEVAETPTTPRVDKGKGRAEPEEEETEKVLSPSYVIDSEDEDGGYGIPEEIAAMMPSPTERYVFKRMVFFFCRTDFFQVKKLGGRRGRDI